jgi:CelD/BcsL family acetyltransferase involved in cellulose biosynthesis
MSARASVVEPRVIRDPDPAAWDDLVSAAPDASVFHTSAWAKVWAGEWRGSRWEGLVIEDGSRYVAAIGAIVRRRGLATTVDAMPYATYGGPIVRADHPDSGASRRALLEAFAERASKRLVARAQVTWYDGDRDAIPSALEVTEGFTHVLPLGADYEQVADGFAPSTRRLVRQADESGLTVKAADSIEDVEKFYAIAVETVRRRGGTPKPLSLYRRIFEQMVPAGLARYHLVLHDGAAVAGSLHLFHQGVAMNWLPVSLESAWHLRPNNYLIASVLETLCAAGYLEYNFGASPPDAAGLIRFKEGWGARPRPVVTASRRSGWFQRLRG